MDHTDEHKKSKSFLIVLACLLASVLLSSYYFFYIKKDYDFSIEGECGSDDEECPSISISARDFEGLQNQ